MLLYWYLRFPHKSRILQYFCALQPIFFWVIIENDECMCSVSGDDRCQFLHNQSTANFESLRQGQVSLD